MKITAQEEYGLRCLLRLAQSESGSLTLPEVAAAEGLSVAYVAKLMAVLRHAGILDSVRGRSGGYTLARPADEIHAPPPTKPTAPNAMKYRISVSADATAMTSSQYSATARPPTAAVPKRKPRRSCAKPYRAQVIRPGPRPTLWRSAWLPNSSAGSGRRRTTSRRSTN